MQAYEREDMNDKGVDVFSSIYFFLYFIQVLIFCIFMACLIQKILHHLFALAT